MKAGHNKQKSKQDYITPWPFIRAVEKRFGQLTIDLAANKKNRRCERYISQRQNSLNMLWDFDGNSWLNPPYFDLSPWVQKAKNTPLEINNKIIGLFPASIGSNWFKHYVYGHSDIYSIGRLKFSGVDDPCMRDLILVTYGKPLKKQYGFYIWEWKKDNLIVKGV